MTYDVISDYQTFRDLKYAWNDLLLASGSYSPQLSHEWLTAFWQHLAGDNKVEVLVHKDKNENIDGFTPLMTRRRKSRLGLLDFTELTFLADELTDYSDFILLGNNRGSHLVHEILPFIAQKQHEVDRINLRRIRYSSPNWQILKREWHDAFHPTYENAIACLGTSSSEYFNSIGKNIRHEVNKRCNTIEKAGISLNVVFFQDWQKERFKEFVAMDEIRASQQGHCTALSKPAVREFFDVVGPQLASRGELGGWVLHLNGEAAAYRLGFIDSKTFLDWQTGYNLKFRQFDIGKIVLAKAIEDCFKRGIEKFNFLMGLEPYKLAWSSEIEFAYSYEWQASRFRNRFQDAVRSAKRLIVG